MEAKTMSGPTESEAEIARSHGHEREPDGDESRLARRVLELPDVGSMSNWYVASAVTLAAAYLETRSAISREQTGKRDE